MGVTFVVEGTEALRDVDGRAARVEPLPGVGNAAEMTRAVAATQIGAGALLVLGRLPRLSSLALAATVLPSAMTNHAFWSADDKQDRQRERSMFVRDLGLLGGLLVAVADTGGRESLPRRARRSARRTAKKAQKATTKLS